MYLTKFTRTDARQRACAQTTHGGLSEATPATAPSTLVIFATGKLKRVGC